MTVVGKALLLCLLLSACNRGPVTWVGVPDGVTLQCAYAAGQEKRCVGGGRVWACIESYQTNTYTCAPFSTTMPPESP